MEKSKEPAILLLPENSSIELNFQSHHFDQESAVFIPAGQFISADEANHCIEVNPKFPNHYRYLFSQVLSIGHVDADEKIKSTGSKDVLDYSSEKWKKLNPFNTTSEELEMLFDANDWLDRNLQAGVDLKSDFLSSREIQKLSREKLRISLFQWKNHKLLNQARQILYESGGSVKETSYQLGFKDTAYFCRFFRNSTSFSPGEFIRTIEEKPQENRILRNFKSLVKEHIQSEHGVAFYADQLNLTSKNLSRIIKSTTGTTAKKHIEAELISTSKLVLQEGHSISSTAFELGFEEISHFSSFFKLHAGVSPSAFLESTNY